MSIEKLTNLTKAEIIKYLEGDADGAERESDSTQLEITGGTWLPRPDDDERIKGAYVLPLRDGGLSFLLRRDGVVMPIELNSGSQEIMPEGVNGEVILRHDDAREMSLPVLTFSLPPSTKR